MIYADSLYLDMDIPREWHPTIVDIQILRLGQFLIAAVPGEFSTMAGRRLREGLVEEAGIGGMPSDTHVCDLITILGFQRHRRF